MRNSRDGLRDIPSRGRAGAKPVSARSPRRRQRERVSSPRNRPFQRRESAVYPNLPCSDLTSNCAGQTRSPRSPLPPTARAGRPCPGQAGPRKGVKMVDIGNGGFRDFHDNAENHFQLKWWKCKKSRAAAISTFPRSFPRTWRRERAGWTWRRPVTLFLPTIPKGSSGRASCRLRLRR